MYTLNINIKIHPYLNDHLRVEKAGTAAELGQSERRVEFCAEAEVANFDFRHLTGVLVELHQDVLGLQI